MIKLVEDGAPKELVLLRKQIDFLGSMTFMTEQAIQNEECIKNVVMAF